MHLTLNADMSPYRSHPTSDVIGCIKANMLIQEFEQLVKQEDLKPLALAHGVYRWPGQTTCHAYNSLIGRIIQKFHRFFYTEEGHSHLTNRALFESINSVVLYSDVINCTGRAPIDLGIRVLVQNAYVYIDYPKNY